MDLTKENVVDDCSTQLKVIQGYIEFLGELSKHRKKYHDYLKRPQENQKDIINDLNEHNLKIPEKAFVSFDPDARDVKIIMRGKTEAPELLQLYGVEYARHVEFFEYKHENDKPYKRDCQEKIDCVEIPHKLRTSTDYSIYIIFPLFRVSTVAVRFEKDPENDIVLSTC